MHTLIGVYTYVIRCRSKYKYTYIFILGLDIHIKARVIHDISSTKLCYYFVTPTQLTFKHYVI